jgi:hypothetical protein
MKRLWVVCIVLVGLAHAARAQAPGQTGPAIEPVTAPFLEVRVRETLARRGIALSRMSLLLRLEPLASEWLVSLVDLGTGRVAASTKIDALPADGDAAVAVVADVVAGLATQVTDRAEPPPPPPPWTQPPAPSASGAEPLQPLGAERQPRDAAEAEFNRRSIRFGPTYDLQAAGNYTAMPRRWTAYQGDVRQKLRPFQFYQAVGRPDLIDSYGTRKATAIAGFVIGGISAGAAYVLFVVATTSTIECPIDSSFHRNCPDASYTPTLLAAAVSGVAFITGIYYVTHLQPLDDGEAKALANEYNQRLRHQLGLPVATRRPRLRDLRLWPYVTGHDAGLAVGARF